MQGRRALQSFAKIASGVQVVVSALRPRDPVSIAQKRLELEDAKMRHLLSQRVLFIAVNPAENRDSSIIVLVQHVGRQLAFPPSFANAPKLPLVDVIPKAEAINLQLQVHLHAVNTDKHVREATLDFDDLLDSKFLLPPDDNG